MRDALPQPPVNTQPKFESCLGGVFAFLMLVAAAAAVFWPHISGTALFIGDSDRLNSLLNIRMFQVRSLQTLGWVPGWNENMFGGYGIAGLHWMQPNYDPFGYLLSFVAVDRVFWIAGFMAALWIILAGWTAYLFIFDTVRSRFPATVGALLYCLSVFSLHRTAQLDSAEMSLILIPVGLLLIRRVQPGNLAVSFLGLATTMSTLAFFGFLQEVAYVFILFGIYAIYRSIADGRMNIYPLLLLSLAAFCSLVIASPRLISVWLDFKQLERTNSFQQTDFVEIWRFFNEGLLGRFQEERLLVGNGLNLHEGLQLLGSTFAAFVIVTGLFRPRDGWQLAGSLLVALVLSAAIIYVVPPYGSVASAVFRGTFSPAGAGFLLNAIGLGLFALMLWRCEPYLQLAPAYRRILPDQPRDRDTGFHLLVLGGVLAAVLIREGQYLVYLLFGRVDFTHSRLSILAVLPASTVAAIFLNELSHGKTARMFDAPRMMKFAVVVGAALLIAWLVRGPLLETFGWIVPRRLSAISDNKLIPAELLKTALAVVVFAVMLRLLIASGHRKDLRHAMVLGLGCVMAFEAIVYGWFKYSGPHTHTYPVAFRSNNYFSAPPCALIPPGESAVKALRERLEVDQFRSVLIADAVKFPAYTEPHIAQFWDLRLLGGYSAGIPLRLGALPWPKDAHQFRAVRFSSADNLPMQLLALVNVKYIVLVNPALYFNLPADIASALAREGECRHKDMAPDQIEVIENPYPATPRQFFAKEIVPISHPDARVGPESVPAMRSVAEGIDQVRQFSTEGTIRARYSGDVISIDVTPVSEERFLVLNEMFSPRWRAYAGESELSVRATNVVMRGVIVPPGVSRIEMRYVPVIASTKGLLLLLVAIAGTLILSGTLRLFQPKIRELAECFQR